MPRCVLPLLLLLAGCAPATPAEREAWQEDFDQMVDHLSAAHANLQWIHDERGLDTHTLYLETRAALGEARSRRAARKVVSRFVAAFEDPHFHTEKGDGRRPAQAGAPDPGIAAGTEADGALDAMGFDSRGHDFTIGFDKLPGFTRISPSQENPFAWGTFTVGERTVGVVRIAQFGDDRYPEVAAPLWPAFAADLDGSCDGSCQWAFRKRVMTRLLGYLAEGATALRDAGVAAVVVDITGNGGGSDWAAVAPRIFAPPLLACPPIGVVRHPHHAALLEREVTSLRTLLADSGISEASRGILEAAGGAVAARLDAVNAPCDVRPLFREAGARPGCTPLVFGPACGAVEYLPPGSLADVPARATVFEPLDATFEEGAWTGPLFVVIDGNTASASEHFVSLLQANGAATLLGERTMGAGCGFIAGGIPRYLEHLDLTVWAPDCARYRADGRNEIEGFAPDVVIDWSGGNRAKARQVHQALSGIL